jgi:hypothetical protein
MLVEECQEPLGVALSKPRRDRARKETLCSKRTPPTNARQSAPMIMSNAGPIFDPKWIVTGTMKEIAVYDHPRKL